MLRFNQSGAIYQQLKVADATDLENGMPVVLTRDGVRVAERQGEEIIGVVELAEGKTCACLVRGVVELPYLTEPTIGHPVVTSRSIGLVDPALGLKLGNVVLDVDKKTQTCIVLF